MELGCARDATVDNNFGPECPGLTGRKPGPDATLLHTMFQFAFFDNTAKNKPDQHNRTGHRRSSNPNLRIRFAALYARAKPYRHVGHLRARSR
jgi:hypothetical protein